MYKFEKGHTHWMKANGPDHVYTLEQVRAGITFPCHPKARRIYPVFIKYEKMRNDVYTSRAAMLEMEARMKRISRSKRPGSTSASCSTSKRICVIKARSPSSIAAVSSPLRSDEMGDGKYEDFV